MLTEIVQDICSFSRLKNRITLVSGFRKKVTVIAATPTIIYIETTNMCNINCIMCPTRIMNRPQENMGMELFKKIILQLDPVLTELIVLHSDGEPLLNNHLPDMISFAKQKKLKVSMSTNAVLLDRNMSKHIINSGLDILTISIDGTTQEVYEKIRKGSDFIKVIGNVKNFLELKGKNPPFVILQMIKMKENKNQEQDFLKMWKKYGKNTYPIIKPAIDWFSEHLQIINTNSSCDRPWFGMVIQSNGNVVPCVHDFDGKYVIGHTQDSPIYDIWNSTNMVKLRKSILKGRQTNNLCKNCNYISPIKHSIFVDSGLAVFGMASIIKLLSIIGYRRAQQL
ncbi:MAG: radical SAM protein [Colwellia sp.]|nr:radical SAM protein [Colwellia sp.]